MLGSENTKFTSEKEYPPPKTKNTKFIILPANAITKFENQLVILTLPHLQDD